MRRGVNRWRLAAGVVAASMAVAALSGCGVGSEVKKLSTAASAAANAAKGLSASRSLKTSPLYGLTKLGRAQLCGVLSRGEASRILGATVIAPQYADRLGLGVTCEWMKSQDSNTELYLGLSSIIGWQGAQAIDKILKATTTSTIDGHPAIEAGPGVNDYALVHVALGGPNDPVVEYRAPTLAKAVQLAQIATPRLLALHH